MNFEQILNVAQILFTGIGVSLKIFFLTLIFAVPLGIIVALARKNKILELPIKLYLLIIRGTPIMLQIIIVYFAPYYLFEKTYDRNVALLIAFVINYAAYFSEIFRSGISSIPVGQKEAAYTLGFSKVKTFFLILLPQIIKIVLPPMSNEIISLLKSTSLAQIIGVTEMFALAQKQASYHFSVIPLFISGMYYLILVLLLTLFFNKAEKKLSYYN